MKKSRGNGGKDMKTVALIIAPALIGAALAQMPAATVQVERATQWRDLLMRRSIGHAEAIKTVKVRTAVEGFLHEIVAKEGSMVEKGDVLYRIYPLQYEAAVKQCEATLAELDAQLKYSIARHSRLQALEQRQATSREDVETAAAKVEELKARRAGAEAELVRARKDLDDCTIRAEISGKLGRQVFSRGNYVTAGEQLNSIVQTDPIYMRFPLSQRDVMGIFRGPKEIADAVDVGMRVASGVRYDKRGKIDIVDNLLAGTTDTYTLWAKFDNPNRILTPGGVGAMFVSLTDTATVTMVPMTAVHYDSEGSFVYTVGEDNSVALRRVVSGTVHGRLQTIYTGLEPGEVVITDGSHKTRVGATVRPVFVQQQKEKDKPAGSKEAPAVVVQTAEVIMADDPTELVCQGARVEPINQVELRPLVQGTLEDFTAKEGDLVQADTELFRIDTTRYRATVNVQKAKLAQLQVSIEDARRKYERQQYLVSRNAGSKDEEENAESQLDQLTAQKAGAEAELVVAEDNLSRCTVRAGMRARIGRVNISVGNYITDIKTPLATLVQISPIYVRFSMSEKDILTVFGNDEKMLNDATLTLVTATGETIEEQGCIAFADNEIRSDTDTQNVWAVFENKDYKLQPGGVVTVKVHRKAGQQMPSVPSEAVLMDTESNYVYVFDNGRAVLTRILTGGITEDGRVIICAGLQAGQRVITSNLAELSDGTAVTPKS